MAFESYFGIKRPGDEVTRKFEIETPGLNHICQKENMKMFEKKAELDDRFTIAYICLKCGKIWRV